MLLETLLDVGAHAGLEGLRLAVAPLNRAC
jgi:hypothetical protein